MERRKDNPEIIKEIQDRIRFILLVAIFFYTVMSKLDDGKFSLSYAGLVSLYFIVYFLFEIFKNKLSPLWLKP